MTRPGLAAAAALLGLAGLAGLGACGDNLPGPDGPNPPDLLDRLRALDGVTVEEHRTSIPGHYYYVLRFTQPVDHDAPGGPTFQQRVSLLHRDGDAPMVALTSGYWDYYRDQPFELTALLAANQISIEHRFFGESRPAPPAWGHLTIRQMAGDQHAIITALRTIYGAAFVTTGGSKGGMTAIYHRRFYPDDVDGTVPYVAPISFGAPDPRYAAYLDTIGEPACRQAVRDTARELLANRRAALLARAEAQAAAQGHAFTRVAIGPALESSIASFEWAFWQYYGAGWCQYVPAVGAADDPHWDFLDQISPVSDSSDARIAEFDAYYYQAEAELGYPDVGAAYLDGLYQYGDADYAGALPTALPPYDGGAAMHDIDAWVQGEGERLLFVYGQWDPWSGGPFTLGAARDSALYVQARGTHGSRLGRLAAADREAAFDRLEAWTGVRPALPSSARAAGPGVDAARGLELAQDPAEPRVPPAVLRAAAASRYRRSMTATGPRVALVTGSTDGIGRAPARALAAAGLKVVIHGRSKVRVDAALAQLVEELPGADLEGVSFDLGSQRAVRAGAAQLLERLPALHVLINNAGIFAGERTVTEDGVELTFAVNHLAPFLLTELLAPRLVASATSAPSRVINVASIAHTRGRIHLDDLTLAAAWTGYAAYAQSKLANVMHALALAERHPPDQLVAYSLHPGVISTKLLRQGFGPVAGAAVEAGARTSIRLAGGEAVDDPSGTYFSDGVATPPAAAARDPKSRAALWEASARLVGA